MPKGNEMIQEIDFRNKRGGWKQYRMEITLK